MDFGLAGIGLGLDLDGLILSERNKLWHDKKKLRAGLDISTEHLSPDVTYFPTTVKQLDPNCNQLPFIEDSACLERIKRKNINRPKEISPPKLSSEPRMRTMVRHGEYSPLNPNFLLPGKFMLGLGEYEERRRQLMIQKKHEYKEYLSQVRLLVHSRNGNPSPVQLDHYETKQNSHGPLNEDKYSELSNNNNKHIQVSEELSNILENRNRLDAAHITTPKHSSIGIQTPSTSMGIFIEEPVSQQHYQYAGHEAENQARLKISTPDVNTSAQTQAGILHSLSVENLSPRERKLADLQVSEQLSKMFIENNQETNPTHTSATNFQARRQSHSAIYKEELRQQIVAKRKLDNELREKEKKEEEAINRRVEEQQEKIRLEYLKEEKKKLEMQKQRLIDFEEYPDHQQKCTRDIKPSLEVPIPRQITSNLETYYPEKIHEHVILSETPVHNSSSNVHTIQHDSQLNQGSSQASSTSENRSPTKHTGQEVSNLVQLPLTLPFRSKSFTVIDSTISNDGYFMKPPVDAGSNILWKPTDRSIKMKSCKTCNFEDSLPIPLFRTKSPLNLPVEISATDNITLSRVSNNIKPANSQAMKKLEAKWQVPAVEKNNITRTTHQGPEGGRQKNVLTQLGAFRRQLQLEQMQTEGFKKVKPQRTRMK